MQQDLANWYTHATRCIICLARSGLVHTPSVKMQSVVQIYDKSYRLTIWQVGLVKLFAVVALLFVTTRLSERAFLLPNQFETTRNVKISRVPVLVVVVGVR
jgi:hypothetical protein